MSKCLILVILLMFIMTVDNIEGKGYKICQHIPGFICVCRSTPGRMSFPLKLKHPRCSPDPCYCSVIIF